MPIPLCHRHLLMVDHYRVRGVDAITKESLANADCATIGWGNLVFLIRDANLALLQKIGAHQWKSRVAKQQQS